MSYHSVHSGGVFLLVWSMTRAKHLEYYAFHFKMKRVHYKDWSPNDAKLAIVTFYFGVSSLSRVGFWRLPYDQVGECWKVFMTVRSTFTVIKDGKQYSFPFIQKWLRLIWGATNTNLVVAPSCVDLYLHGASVSHMIQRFLCDTSNPDTP
jgi:hypothetical protein